MKDGQEITADELSQLAKQARTDAGLTQAEAAERMGVAQPTLAQAENEPQRSLRKLRRRMIFEFAGYELDGPFWRLRRK